MCVIHTGPRRPGEGVENEEQGIISAEMSPTGAVTLRITLLAAGFIIGGRVRAWAAEVAVAMHQPLLVISSVVSCWCSAGRRH
jgi:hypothetical protein